MSKKRLMLVSSLVSFAMGSSAAYAKCDHEAMHEAAQKCGMPRPGEGVPTAAQEDCMTKAGFPKPKDGGQAPSYKQDPSDSKE